MSDTTSALASFANQVQNRQATQRAASQPVGGPGGSALGGMMGQMMKEHREQRGKETTKKWLKDNGGDPSQVDLDQPGSSEYGKAEIARTLDNLKMRRAASMLGQDATGVPGGDAGGDVLFGAKSPLNPNAQGLDYSASPTMPTSGLGDVPAPAAPPQPTTTPNISMPGDYGNFAPPPSGPRPQGMMGSEPFGTMPAAPRSQGMAGDGTPFGNVAPPQAAAPTGPATLPQITPPNRQQMQQDILKRFSSGVGGFDAGGLRGALGFLPPEAPPPRQFAPTSPEDADLTRAQADLARAQAEKARRPETPDAPKAPPRTPFEDTDIPDDIEGELETRKGLGAGSLAGKNWGAYSHIPDPKEKKAEKATPFPEQDIPDDLEPDLEGRKGLKPGALKGKKWGDFDHIPAPEKTSATREGALSDQARARATFVRGEIARLTTEKQQQYGAPTPDLDMQIAALRAEYDRIAPPVTAPAGGGAPKSSLGDVPAPAGSPPPNGPDPVVSPQAAAAGGADDNAGATPEELATINGDPAVAAAWKVYSPAQKATLLKGLREP